jgi:hypothetical protein
MGRAGGTCVLKPLACVLSSQAYQCDCYSHHLSERRPSECDSASNLIDGCICNVLNVVFQYIQFCKEWKLAGKIWSNID